MGKYLKLRLSILKDELEEKLKEIKKDIEDFASPLKYSKEDIQERIDGRLSTKALQENYKLKIEIENEIDEIKNYLYCNN